MRLNASVRHRQAARHIVCARGRRHGCFVPEMCVSESTARMGERAAGAPTLAQLGGRALLRDL